MVSSLDRSEGGRRFFQQRLALLFQLGAAISAAFLGLVVGIRGLLGAPVFDELSSPSRLCHLGATLVVLVAWLLVRRGDRGLAVLQAIDVSVSLLLCLLLDLQAVLFPLRTVAVFNIALTTGVVLILRAILVPSPTWRTVFVAVVAMCVATGCFFLPLHRSWPVASTPFAAERWPLGYQLVSLVMWLGTLCAISIVASRTIYDLRRDVREAQKLGQYVLGRKLGEGGMGVVFRATHAMLRRETALKLLLPERIDPQSLRRFEREVVQTARLRHPNTVAIYDYGRTPEGLFYYAMEYLDGLTLERLVDSEGPLAPGRVVHILAQVLASLDEAHAEGLVHRDIKPANIMVTGHPSAWDLVKVLDFGLVKDTSGMAEVAQLTNPAFLLGSPQYVSPEAIDAPESVGPQSDLYSVAAVGYFLLTGTPVFLDRTLVAVCAAHLDRAPEPPSARLGRAAPPDLEKLLLLGLTKNPAARPASAQAFRDALVACDVPKWTESNARAWWQDHLRKGPAVIAAEPLPATVTPERSSISVRARGVREQSDSAQQRVTGQ